MKQETLFDIADDEKSYNPDVILVDTLPKNARNQGSLNLGLILVSDKEKAKIIKWWEKLDRIPPVVMFNVIYPTHIFNMIAFMKRNGIETLKNKRKDITIVVGGQGASNLHCLYEIADLVWLGEYDGKYIDSKGWNRKLNIDTPVCFDGDKAVIELARGCKYRCKFCEYGCVFGGEYREKPLELVKEQIKRYIAKGIYQFNFMSSNFAGYTYIKALLGYCGGMGVHVTNRDVCLMDIENIMDYIGVMKMHYLKIGVESFDEETRKKAGKNISDDKMKMIFEKLLTKIGALHLYLIFGLPNDNYDKWFEWVEWLGNLRKKYTCEENTLFGTEKVNTKNIRIEMSITNFEPCLGTPLENAEEVDFRKKEEFLGKWVEALRKHGFYTGESEKDYKNARGRWGRKELSYQLLMTLKKRNNITEAIINAFDNGIGRSIKDDQAEQFLKLTKGDGSNG